VVVVVDGGFGYGAALGVGWWGVVGGAALFGGFGVFVLEALGFRGRVSLICLCGGCGLGGGCLGGGGGGFPFVAGLSVWSRVAPVCWSVGLLGPLGFFGRRGWGLGAAFWAVFGGGVGSGGRFCGGVGPWGGGVGPSGSRTRRGVNYSCGGDVHRGWSREGRVLLSIGLFFGGS